MKIKIKIHWCQDYISLTIIHIMTIIKTYKQNILCIRKGGFK